MNGIERRLVRWLDDISAARLSFFGREGLPLPTYYGLLLNIPSLGAVGVFGWLGACKRNTMYIILHSHVSSSGMFLFLNDMGY
jgi:hypothetical protein